MTIDWPRLRREAEQRFGVKRFRPGQREIIDAVLNGRDVLGVLPTGGGKSLTYQLPSLLLPNSVVVVSPLISLMQDQQEKAEDADIGAAKLDSTLTTTETRDAMHEIRRGEHELIYVTPERLENPEYRDLLKKSGVSLFVVDEAHCVSQWGHDFRPAYLNLRDSVRALGHPPVLALTATATEEVASDIKKQLGIEDAELVSTGIDRKNLFFEVFRTVNGEAKRERIRSLLREEPEGTGIIYTATVRTANELCSWLKDDGTDVDRYHGKVRMREREDIQRRFMNNELRVLVATKAFGLGVDKPDIRFVIHYAFPDSLESYYQEAGRAGRDGKPARASLLYRLEDRRVQGFFLGGKYPRRDQSLRIFQLIGERTDSQPIRMPDLVEASGIPKRKVQVIVAQLESAGVIERRRAGLRKKRDFQSDEEFNAFLTEYEQRGMSDRERLQQMMRYAESTTCRMKTLKDYFGEENDQDCGHCDNCKARAEGRLRAPQPTLDKTQPASKKRQAKSGTLHAARNNTATPPLSEQPFGLQQPSDVQQPSGIIAAVALNTPPPPDFLQHEPALFNIGDHVRHRKFGPGEVIEISGDNITAKFQSGSKRVRAQFLRAA